MLRGTVRFSHRPGPGGQYRFDHAVPTGCARGPRAPHVPGYMCGLRPRPSWRAGAQLPRGCECMHPSLPLHGPARARAQPVAASDAAHDLALGLEAGNLRVAREAAVACIAYRTRARAAGCEPSTRGMRAAACAHARPRARAPSIMGTSSSGGRAKELTQQRNCSCHLIRNRNFSPRRSQQRNFIFGVPSLRHASKVQQHSVIWGFAGGA